MKSRTSLTVVTFNLLNDLTYWPERAPLVLQGLRDLAPDVIALQEVVLPLNNAEWLAGELGDYTVYLCPKTGRQGRHEALALLSRIPVLEHETVAYGVQGRVAQRIVVRHGEQKWTIANTHLHFSLVDDTTRREQVQRMIEWLPRDEPVVLCGDMNALPHYLAISGLRQRFVSAHAGAHQAEPAYTYPTPLKRGPGWRHQARNAGLRALGLTLAGRPSRWQGTLDYIFVDPSIRILRCVTALDQPAPHDELLYPSDHIGLVAELELG